MAYVRGGDIEALVVGRVGIHRIFWAAWVLGKCHRLCPRCGGVLEHREERAALKALRCWRLRTDTGSQANRRGQSDSQTDRRVDSVHILTCTTPDVEDREDTEDVEDREGLDR